MELDRAERIADMIKAKLAPCCERIEVAGSIRRRRPFVHDIDIVLIPSNQGQLAVKLQELGKLKMGGQKLIRVEMPSGIMLDVYIATPQTWATLLLIRTGSARHNIHLCTLARRQGRILKADGSGLFDLTDCQGSESRVAGDTEESIFEALGLKYKKPEERE